MAVLRAAVTSVTTIFGSFRRLQREQWLPPEQLATLRRERLRRVLARAIAAPFYRAALLEAGAPPAGAFELDDLRRLPLVDRLAIARHGLESFLTLPADRLFPVTTSGSTGTPGRFLRSWAEEAAYSARWMRVYRAYGCGIFDGQLNVAGPPRPDRPGAVNWMRKIGLLPPVERLAAGTPPARVLERLQAVRPAILTGYAGAIEGLADHVLATGATVRPPKAVFCTAMEVTERCLQLAAQAFQAPAVDVYVSNEFGVTAWSCPVRRELLHVDDDSFVVEVLGPDGEPAPPGSVGELVITSLGLEAMPLVRYRTGDMAARVAGRCECGRGLGLMTRVQGRTAHCIRRPDGGLIITPLITNLFGRARAYEWVRQFQVREQPGRRLRVLVDARQPPTDAQRRMLVETLQTGIGPEFGLDLELVDTIPPAPSGKLQFLVPL